MTKKARSLAQFVSDKKRATIKTTCAVCKLAPSVRKEIRAASAKNYTHHAILTWLTEELRLKITQAELRQHTNGKHEFYA